VTTAAEVLYAEGLHLGAGGDEFWDWYPAPHGTAWCCIFQSWSLTQCGMDIHFAWVSGLFDWAKSQGWWSSTDIRQAQPGDCVAFEWGSTPGGYDHIAMILSVTDSGCWTRNGNVNGSRVRDLWFPFDGGGMAELVRPPYTVDPPAPAPEPVTPAEPASVPTPEPAPTPQPSQEDDMVVDAMIRDPRTGAVYRITQPGNVAVHLDPAAFDAAVAAGVKNLGDVGPEIIGQFGLLPNIGS
jgi:hypothetical protein